MAKEFGKKWLLGVLVSLTSVAIVGAFASLTNVFKAEEESAATCTHTKIIEVSGVAPTCTESGLTDGIFCGVCHGVIKAQQVIDPLGHQLVDVPGYAATCVTTGLTDGKTCGVCEAVVVAQKTIPKSLGHNFEDATCVDCGMPDLTVYDEVEVASGELVAGNWYRIYDGNTMALSADLVGSYYEDKVHLYCSFSESNGFVSYAGHSSACTADNMMYEITEDYIDVYLAPGEYSVSYSTATFEITEETTITAISGTIYRLIPPAEGE